MKDDKDIIIKQVLSTDGSFEHLELWQGSQCIKLGLGNTDLQTVVRSYQWNNLRQVIDKVADSINTYK